MTPFFHLKDSKVKLSCVVFSASCTSRDILGSLSKAVFELKASTRSGLYILGQWIYPNFRENRLCKRKDSKQYNFGSFKAYSFKG